MTNDDLASWDRDAMKGLGITTLLFANKRTIPSNDRLYKSIWDIKVGKMPLWVLFEYNSGSFSAFPVDADDNYAGDILYDVRNMTNIDSVLNYLKNRLSCE